MTVTGVLCNGLQSASALCLQAALRAREAGSTRFCMGAAWRGPSQVGPRQWERVLEMVRRIRGLGMEVRVHVVPTAALLYV
jgi:biotin synthase-like enzyme